MRKFLLAVLFIVLCIALVYKSPFSAMYNYNKARSFYDRGEYEQSLPYFEKSLFADNKGILTRFFYVLALTKSEPVYSVQKNLYNMANSRINDEASSYAKAQAAALRYRLIEGISNNYIYNAAMGNDIVRWNIESFPLKVYFEDKDSVPSFYIEQIERAMQVWSENTNFVKFSMTDNKQEAEVVILFKKTPENLCTNGYCKYVTAYTEPDIDKDKILRRMVMTFYRTNPLNKGFTPKEIFNTALHEFGHTLGIMGHSDNPGDIMFSLKEDPASMFALYSSAEQSLSLRDLKTLVLLYRIKPTISNVKNLSSESFYYAPLILGSENTVLIHKLAEYQKYVAAYPNMASGYINLASVYADLGDSNSALQNLAVAESLTNNTDEQYVIMYNRAVIYFNAQKYREALDYANKAKAIKNENNVNDLISDIIKLQ